MKAIKEINELCDAVEQGTTDALTAYLDIKRLEKALSDAKKAIEESAIDEAEKHGKKTFQFKGAEITKKSAPGRYDFKHLPDWKEQKNALKEIEEAHKEAYKLASKGRQMVTADGEVIEPAKYTPGKDIISVKFID